MTSGPTRRTARSWPSCSAPGCCRRDGEEGRRPIPGALTSIKVIDLTRVLGGPYCTMVLSDHGAEVIKIEPPQGDEVRDWGPAFDGRGTPATSSA